MFDPNELHNLAENTENSAVLVDMRVRLKNWMQATANPLLEGPVVPALKGEMAHDLDGLSP